MKQQEEEELIRKTKIKRKNTGTFVRDKNSCSNIYFDKNYKMTYKVPKFDSGSKTPK